MFVWDTFLGERRDESLKPHEAPWGMLLAPLIPASLSILLGLLPEPEQLASFLATAAGIAYGGEVKVSLALWAGLTVPLLLSIIAVSTGLVIFAFRKPIRGLQGRIGGQFSLNTVYTWILGSIDRIASHVTRLQSGYLRHYLLAILTGMIIIVILFVGLIGFQLQMEFSPLTFDLRGEIALLRIFTLIMVVGASAATILLRRDLSAIIALGAAGLAVALVMVLEPAPDVALVQIVVDILAMVILTIALSKIPRAQRQAAQLASSLERGKGIRFDVLIASFSGFLVGVLTFAALVTRPRISTATAYYEANAKLLAGAKDIVGAIVVDFRAFDTLIEIAVFSLAGLGISAILQKAAHAPHGESLENRGSYLPFLDRVQTTGISGGQTSSFLHALAYLSLPLSLVIASIHVLYGHDQPGDGFTAGVIISLAIGFWYVIFGYEGVRSRLTWLKPVPLIGSGVILALATAFSSWLISGVFFGHVDYDALLGIRLPAGVDFSSALLFEISILLAVLGSATLILDSLGHPGEDHPEIEEISDGGPA
jgi:multicomponent K+:H+ antiporter subunit A